MTQLDSIPSELSTWQWFDDLDMESQVRLVAASHQRNQPLSSVLAGARRFEERRSSARVVSINLARRARLTRDTASTELLAELLPLAAAVAAATKE